MHKNFLTADQNNWSVYQLWDTSEPKQQSIALSISSAHNERAIEWQTDKMVSQMLPFVKFFHSMQTIVRYSKIGFI